MSQPSAVVPDKSLAVLKFGMVDALLNGIRKDRFDVVEMEQKTSQWYPYRYKTTTTKAELVALCVYIPIDTRHSYMHIHSIIA
jgi:hypothetical protein